MTCANLWRGAEEATLTLTLTLTCRLPVSPAEQVIESAEEHAYLGDQAIHHVRTHCLGEEVVGSVSRGERYQVFDVCPCRRHALLGAAMASRAFGGEVEMGTYVHCEEEEIESCHDRDAEVGWRIGVDGHESLLSLSQSQIHCLWYPMNPSLTKNQSLRRTIRLPAWHAFVP